MKKILFDLSVTQPIGATKIHGGGKYGIVVCKKLIEIAPEKVAVFYNPNVYLDESIKEILQSKHIETHYTEDGSIAEIAGGGEYVIYTPLFNDTYLKTNCSTILATIHGLRILEMPTDEYEKYYVEKQRGFISRLLLTFRLYRLRQWLKRKRALQYIKLYERWFADERCRFMVVSEHTKASLMSFVPSVNTSSLPVFYSPSTIEKNIESPHSMFYGQKFWLMVSGNRWLKNCLRAIEAFDSLFTQRPELEGSVVIAGLEKLDFRHFKIKNIDRFVPLGYVSESELKALYHDAYLFVYPSLNEGFGYPPLESMCEGTPVIASAVASIPEVCGDAVMYFNPTLVSEIKMRILQMEDRVIRNEFAERGRQRQAVIEEKQDRDLVALCNLVLDYV